jgi:fructose-1,6-bisphosphatase
VKLRTTRVSLMSDDAAIFEESVTHIYIDDEAAGEFVVVSQHDHTKVTENRVAINPSEWPMLRRAIDQMIKECRTT